MEDREIIQLNIRHYRELLKLQSSEETRTQVKKLLAEAEAQLRAAETGARDRRR